MSAITNNYKSKKCSNVAEAVKNKRHYEVKCRGSGYTVGMGPKRKVAESMESKRKVTKTMRPKKVNKRLTTEDSVVGNRGIEVLIIFDRPLKSSPTTFNLSRTPEVTKRAAPTRVQPSPQTRSCQRRPGLSQVEWGGG